MNEYDSSKMADVLEATLGAQRTSSPEEADAILINTCAIREKAQEKLYHALGRFRAEKENRPLLIGVGGCVAALEREKIFFRAPYVDFLFSPQTVHRVPELLQLAQESKKTCDFLQAGVDKFDAFPTPRHVGTSAFVSIMEGCGKRCSFCVVPFTRGDEIFRPLSSILAETAEAALLGAKEIILLGQNVSAWEEKREDGRISFAMLLDAVSAVPGVERVRFTTSHPLDIDDDLIQAFARLPKLASHIHLPVQSGSNRILRAMGRGYTHEEYLDIVSRLRGARSDLSISSDFIVGFPGETEEDFADTLSLVGKVGFDSSFSFIFSPRPGTPAENLPRQVPVEAKQERLLQLQRLLEKSERAILEAMVGMEADVLAETPAKKGQGELCGRTSRFHFTHFLAPPSTVGKMVRVRIIQALSHTLRGQVIAC